MFFVKIKKKIDKILIYLEKNSEEKQNTAVFDRLFASTVIFHEFFRFKYFEKD